MSDEVKCPKCGSTQVHAEKRGWSLMKGMIGSGKIILTCFEVWAQIQTGRGGVRI